MKNHVQMNYSKITPHIYLGTNACCVRQFDTGRRQGDAKEPILLGLIRDDNIYEIGFEAAY